MHVSSVVIFTAASTPVIDAITLSGSILRDTLGQGDSLKEKDLVSLEA